MKGCINIKTYLKIKPQKELSLLWRVNNLLFEGQVLNNQRHLCDVLQEDYNTKNIKSLMQELQHYIKYEKVPNTNKLRILEIYKSSRTIKTHDQESINILIENEKVDFYSEKIIGVYGIYNSITHLWYIGRSKDIIARWKDHNCELVNGTHYNSRLQDDYTLYGPSVFYKYILYMHPPNGFNKDLSEMESEFIKLFNSKQSGYNIQS